MKLSKHWINLTLYILISVAFFVWAGKDNYKKYKLYNQSPTAKAKVLKNPFYSLLNSENRYGYHHDLDFKIQKKHIVYSFLTNDNALITDSIRYSDYGDPDFNLGNIIISPFQNTPVGKTLKVTYLERDPLTNIPEESIRHMSKSERRTEGFSQGIIFFLVFIVFLGGFIYEIRKNP